jgi:hypothetical protein
MPGDIRAAKLGGACIGRGHCTKSDRREQCRSGRRCRFQKLFHHVLLFFLVSALAPRRSQYQDRCAAVINPASINFEA